LRNESSDFDFKTLIPVVSILWVLVLELNHCLLEKVPLLLT
jgi:hypothetical protein